MTKESPNDQFRASSFLAGGNAAYVEGLHQAFGRDPASLDPSWREFFAALSEPASPGPSWARPDWPPVPTDDLTAALTGEWPEAPKVAEKVQAMVELGMANTRLKDFFDVWLLLRDFDLSDEALAAAIRATFDRRRTPLPVALPTALSDAFGQDDVKRTEWDAFVRRAGLADTAPSLREVVATLRGRLASSLGLK